MDANDDDYEVGYMKPPKHTQFKKGQSGNPKGRPKGTKNFKTDLMEEFSEQITITEGGKQMPVSKQRAMIKRTMQKALSGEIPAIRLLAGWGMLLDVNLADDAAAAQLSPDDEAILRQYLDDHQDIQKDPDEVAP